MSFRGYTQEDDPPITFAAAIHQADGPDITFITCAGNDASCRPTWPAVDQHVIGVGTLHPVVPAPFTNYGPHVQACAPGVDVISTFRGEMDPDRERKYANPVRPRGLPGVGLLEWDLLLGPDRRRRAGVGGHVDRPVDPRHRRAPDQGREMTRIAGLGTMILNVCSRDGLDPHDERSCTCTVRPRGVSRPRR